MTKYILEGELTTYEIAFTGERRGTVKSPVPLKVNRIEIGVDGEWRMVSEDAKARWADGLVVVFTWQLGRPTVYRMNDRYSSATDNVREKVNADFSKAFEKFMAEHDVDELGWRASVETMIKELEHSAAYAEREAKRHLDECVKIRNKIAPYTALLEEATSFKERQERINEQRRLGEEYGREVARKGEQIDSLYTQTRGKDEILDAEELAYWRATDSAYFDERDKLRSS